MDLISTRNADQREPQLTRDDWIVAALHALLAEGIEAVQITRLARDLNVTRGSFYWHFKSRQDLLDGILAEWRARNTGIMIDVLTHAPRFEAGILDLFSVWADHSRFDARLDQAIRDWGRRASDIRHMVETEDDDRLQAITGFFVRHGYEPTEAFIRARVIYFTQLSYYALGVNEPMDKRMSYLAAYFQCFTGRDIDAGIAKAFKTRILVQMKKP